MMWSFRLLLDYYRAFILLSVTVGLTHSSVTVKINKKQKIPSWMDPVGLSGWRILPHPSLYFSLHQSRPLSFVFRHSPVILGYCKPSSSALRLPENILNSALQSLRFNAMLEKEDSLLQLDFVTMKQSKMNLNLSARFKNNEKCKCSRPWEQTDFTKCYFVFQSPLAYSYSGCQRREFNNHANAKLYSSRPMMRLREITMNNHVFYTRVCWCGRFSLDLSLFFPPSCDVGFRGYYLTRKVVELFNALSHF